MSEFLLRGYNTAIPEVDIGDDVFVVKDATGEFRRIQVKSAKAESRGYGYSANFRISLEHLEARRTPDSSYVLAVRQDTHWSDFLLITREELYEHYANEGLGTLYEPRHEVRLYLRFEEPRVTCDSIDLTPWLNTWRGWPPVAR